MIGLRCSGVATATCVVLTLLLVAENASAKDGGLPPGSSATLTCSDYTNFTPDHSACLKTPVSCSIKREGVTEDEKTAILKAHNTFRAKVANGQEKQGNPGPQPPASNMRELVWNDELAAVAQALAFSCEFKHDCIECRKLSSRDYYVGQNLHWSGSYSSEQVWEGAISQFYNEVAKFPKSGVTNYKFNLVYGHYTQVVWAETYEIGCGAVYNPCKGMPWCKTYVCNYGPGGNTRGGEVYKIGTPASICPFGKSKNYEGLCN